MTGMKKITMTHQREQVEETWEIEFDNTFTPEYWAEIASEFAFGDVGAQKVKSFIKTLLATAVKQRDEEVIKMIEGMPRNFPEIESNEYDAGYTAACQDIKALLQD
jgi:carbonic anhydrase